MTYDPGAMSRVISVAAPDVRDVFGPTIEILTSTAGPSDTPAILRGLVPAAVTIPLHAHSDPETFYVLSGQIQGLTVGNDEPAWSELGAGEVFYVPPKARHAFRNVGAEPCRVLILSTITMARFFEAVGTPLSSADALRSPPTAAELRQFATESLQRGYWNASPAENAAVGIDLPLLVPR